MDFGKKAKTSLHVKPQKLLDEIQKIVIQQNLKFEKTYKEIQQDLRLQGIHISRRDQTLRGTEQICQELLR
jgi:hypothetical protein